MNTSSSNSTNKGYENGTECIARYDFKGSGVNDLPLKKGDIIVISNKTKDPNWYKATRSSDGKTGLIPINYVQPRRGLLLHEMPWFYGKILRDKAEKLLYPRQEGLFLVRQSTSYADDYTLCVVRWFYGKISRDKAEQLLTPRQVGLFLVRQSTNYPDDYTLCVVSGEGKVEHYRVINRQNRVTVDEESYFSNLIELVKHYEKDADGLCTRLKKPFIQSKGMSSQDFKSVFYKEVFRGVYGQNPVAIKRLKDDSKAAQSFLDEASVMTRLRHRNLVDLIGISFQGNEILILTEFCSKGSLVEYLRTRGRTVIKQEEQMSFARDVCAGMAYLEGKQIIHRDLAARNVLLSEDLCAKVSDFGLAKDVEQQIETGKFPVKWTAPEAIQQKVFSSKSDVWSFGILLWEIFSFGRNPYPRIPMNETLNKVLQGYRNEIPDKCPAHLFNLMKRCWELNPKDRPSFKDILPRFNPERETKL